MENFKSLLVSIWLGVGGLVTLAFLALFLSWAGDELPRTFRNDVLVAMVTLWMLATGGTMVTIVVWRALETLYSWAKKRL